MNNTTVQIPKKVFNESYLQYLDNTDRYLVLYGGAGSGKSYFIAERYIYKLLKSPLCNLLVVRAVGKSNRDSTFALFKQVLSKWNLSKYFKYNESDLRIKCLLNGNEVIFKGLDDTEKLKSITYAKGVLTDIWIEETSEIDEQSFKQLDIRLRGKGTKKQMVISFNPIDVNHWLKKMFFDNTGDNVTINHSTYKDNRFLDDDYRKLLESYKDTDPYYYDVYCLGRWGVYGKTIFDARKIQYRLDTIPEPIRQGLFLYDYDGLNLTNIRWQDDSSGYIKIYSDSIEGTPYVIGGDTAGDGSDNFTGQVLDNTTGKQVATLKHQFDEDIYARQMYCLGTYYNMALIGIEANFSTYPIKELQRLKYNNQYVRETEDTFTGKIKNTFGFKTTSLTRPVIISELVKIAREDIGTINDKSTLEEMLTFVRNEKGRPEAMSGAHDDLIIGLAIAHYIRPQQSYASKTKPTEKAKWTQDMYNDYYKADKSDKQLLISRWGNPF